MLYSLVIQEFVRSEGGPLSREEEAQVAALYREHSSFVWRNARRLGAQDEWVEDVVHEVFLALTRQLRDFRGEATIRTWLFAVTFRVVKAMLRNRTRDRRKVELHGLEAPRAHHPERQAAAAATLRTMLAQLDEPKRLVVILSELEGMTAPEISQALGVPTGTVDSRLRAARIELSRMAHKILAKERRTA